MGKIYIFFGSWFIVQLCQALSKNERLMHDNQKVFIWNRTLEYFRNPHGKSLYEFHLKSKPLRYSVRNKTIRVLADNMEPYIIISSKDSRIRGYLGDTWNIMEDYLKFKSNITRSADFDDGLLMISRNEADVFLAAAVHYSGLTGITFSQPYFFTWYHVYFKLPIGRPSLYVHFNVFSLELWCRMVISFVILTLALWSASIILQKASKKAEIRLSPVTYFMGTISAFLNTGYDLRLRSCSARIIIFVALVFGTLCYYALSASLVARLAVLDRPIPFDDLDSVAACKTHSLCVRNVSFVYRNFTDLTRNRTVLPKWQDVVNTGACVDMRPWHKILTIICKDNVAVFENRILMSMVFNDNRLSCGVTHLPQRYFSTGNYISISKKFKGKKTLIELMTRMKSSGILSKLENRWIRKRNGDNTLLTEANQITFDHIKGVVGVYVIMSVVSLLVLILEIFYKMYWEILRAKVVNKMSPKIPHIPYRN